MLNPKTMEKMSPGHVRDLCSNPSHHRPRSLGGKNGFMGQAHVSSPCCVQSRDLVPCFSAALAMAKRGQCTVPAMASEGANTKPWHLPHGIQSAGTQKSTIKV